MLSEHLVHQGCIFWFLYAGICKMELRASQFIFSLCSSGAKPGEHLVCCLSSSILYPMFCYPYIKILCWICFLPSFPKLLNLLCHYLAELVYFSIIFLNHRVFLISPLYVSFAYLIGDHRRSLSCISRWGSLVI